MNHPSLTPLYHLYTRDLTRLKEEISSFSSEQNLWKPLEGIHNPSGNLCLHLVGNLQHFIGKILGKTSYVRQREEEFSRTDLSKAELMAMVDETIAVVQTTLSGLTEAQLTAVYPLQIFKEKMSTLHMLMHLESHLTYHLGQINYHRRIVEP